MLVQPSELATTEGSGVDRFRPVLKRRQTGRWWAMRT